MPVEVEYAGSLALKVTRVKALAAPPAYLNMLYMSVCSPYMRRLPSLTPSFHANSEQRARRRRFLSSRSQQESWCLPPLMRIKFFATLLTWFSHIHTPIGSTTQCCLVAYHARNEIYRSSLDAASVTIAI